MADEAQAKSEEAGDKHPKVKIRLPSGEVVVQPLPPINKIRIPNTNTKSATIRWLAELGYEVKDISNHLGLRYQMVRNIKTTIPKRAAREDLPEQVVEYLPETDEIQDALDGALEAGMLEARRERKAAAKEERRQQGLED